MLTFWPMQTEESPKEGEPKDKDFNVYEISFLMVPSISEEKLPETVSALKSVIEDAKGLFISESFPKMMPLSYTMVRKIDGKGQKFDNAYFGWVKFEIDPENIKKVKEAFSDSQDVLRFLITKTVRQNTLYSYKLNTKKERAPKVTKKQEEVEAPEVSEEEIDKSIDELVVS